MDLVLLVLAILFLCIPSIGLGYAVAITTIVYVIIHTIVEIIKEGR